jgi:RNA polymerase-binding transcription factor DksA
VPGNDIQQSHLGGSPGFDAGEVAAFLGELDQEMTAVEETLRRLDAGTYGRCMACDELIDRVDLDADPLAQRCTRHS